MSKKSKKTSDAITWEQALNQKDYPVLGIHIVFMPMTFLATWSIFINYLSRDDEKKPFYGFYVLPKAKEIEKLLNKLAKKIAKQCVVIDIEAKQHYALDNPGLFFVLDIYNPIAIGSDVSIVRAAIWDEFIYWAEFWHNRDKRQRELMEAVAERMKEDEELDWMKEIERVEEIIDIEYPRPFKQDDQEALS